MASSSLERMTAAEGYGGSFNRLMQVEAVGSRCCDSWSSTLQGPHSVWRYE